MDHKYTKICHISDLHIFSPTIENIYHAFDVLIKSIDKKTILVITGDIFEFKTHASDNDIKCFRHLCQQIYDHKVHCVMIPGNHDYNDNKASWINDSSSTTHPDLVTLLLDSKYSNYIKCYPDSGVYNHNNIDFYVFSPIDNKIPDMKSSNNYKVALIHEPVYGAEFYNGIKIDDARFKVKDLKKFDIACLGDIHKPQFLADNVGYSGSFVQKNLGEDLNHGYIMWNLKQKKGKFIPIQLKQFKLKLAIKNNESPDLQLSDGAFIDAMRYFAVEYEDCTPEFICEFEQSIKEAGQQIDKVSYRTKKVKDFNINPTKIFEEYVQQVFSSNAKELIELHKKYLHEDTRCFNKWELKWLKWENLFTYGKSNHIEFDKLDNLVFIIGKNKIGKSFIIDILIWLLYNVQLRGQQKYMLNTETVDKYGWGACCFKVGKHEYIIERVINDKRNYLIKLTKDGEVVTGKDVRETYSIMQGLIGNHHDFTTISVALQNRVSFVDLVPRDRANFICKFLGLDVLSDIEKIVKEKLRKFKTVLKVTAVDAIEKPSDDIVSSIEEDKQSLDTLTRKYKQILAEKEQQLKQCQTVKTLTNDDKQLIAKYKDKLNEVDLTEENYLSCVAIAQTKTTELEKLTWKIKKCNQALEKARSDILKYDNYKVVSVEETIPDLNALRLEITHVEPVEGDLNLEELEQRRNVLLAEDIGRVLLKVPSSGKFIELNKTKEQCENKIKALNEKINALKLHIVPVKSITRNVKFSSSCTNCVHNKKVLGFDQLEINKKCEDRIDQITEILCKWKNMLVQLELNEKILYNEKVNELLKCEQSIVYIRNRAKLDELARWEKLEKQVLFNTLSTNIDSLLTKIESMEDKEHCLEKDLVDVTEKIRIHDVLTRWTLHRKNKKVNKKIKDLAEQLDFIEQQISQLTKKVTDETVQYKTNLAAYETYIKNEALLTERRKTYELYRSYACCLDQKKGVPAKILKEIRGKLVDECNDFLDKVTDFNISMEFNDAGYDISTTGRAKPIPAAMASGFQKFIIDLSIRVAVSKVCSIPLPNILIVDEGFGCSDTENLTVLRDTLPNLAKHYDFVLIISHVETLKSTAKHSIVVNVDKKISSVQYGIVDYNTKLIEKKEKVEKSGKELSKMVKTLDKNIVQYEEYWTCKVCLGKYKHRKNAIKKHIESNKHRSMMKSS